MSTAKPSSIQSITGRQHGMTLIETMVAMTISSILILGSIQMYAQARSNYRTTESVARMQENLRFSIDILDADVRLAGFWGKTNSSSATLEVQADVTVTCGGNNVTDWVMKTNTPIEALQQASDPQLDDCPGFDPRENSDILILRHAAVAQDIDAPPIEGVVQIQSSGSYGVFFNNGENPGTLNSQIFDVEFNAYYISKVSKYDENLPSLRRLSLVGNRIEDQEIIPGVENLQVQFGIDSTGNGQVDMYVNGDDALIATSPVIVTRLWLLVRSEQNEAGQGYKDNKGPYETPDASINAIDPLGDDAEDYPPTYRRMALSRTIVMRNR